MSISIIIPFYKSLNDQYMINSYNKIMIDDGMGEDVYVDRSFNNIIIYHQSHKGPGPARNLGIRKARTKYVYFLDADDEMPDEAVLKKMVDIAEKTDAKIVGGSMLEVRQDGSRFCDWQDVNKRFVFDKEGWVDYKDYQFDYGFYRFIYKTSFLRWNFIRFPKLWRFQDPPFFVKAMLKAKRFYAIPDTTYIYHAGDTSKPWSKEKAVDCVKGIIMNLEKSKKYGLHILHYASILRLYNDFAKKIIPHMEDRQLQMLIQRAENLKDIKLLERYNEEWSMAQDFIKMSFYEFNRIQGV